MTSELDNFGAQVRLVDSATCAELLGISISTLHRWTRDGKLQPVVEGSGVTGARFYDRDTIEKLAATAKPKVSL